MLYCDQKGEKASWWQTGSTIRTTHYLPLFIITVVKRKRLEHEKSTIADPYLFHRSNIRTLRPRNLTVINDRLCVSHAEKVLLGRPGDDEAARVGVMRGACEIDS